MNNSLGRKILLMLMTTIMFLGVFNLAPVQAASLNVVRGGDAKTFINNMDMPDYFIDMTKVTRDNVQIDIKDPNIVQFNDKEGGLSVDLTGNFEVGGEYSSAEGIIVTFPEAIVMNDASRADLKITLTNAYFKMLRTVDDPDLYGLSLFRMSANNTVYLFTVTQDSEGYTNMAKQSETDATRTDKRAYLHRSIDVKFEVVKDGVEQNGTFAYGLRDLDVIDYETQTFDGPFAEGIDLKSGYGDIYIPESNFLNFQGSRIWPTQTDSNTFNSGFATLASSGLSYTWYGSGGGMGTVILDTLPFHIVKDSVIGGGEIKYISPEGEKDQAMVAVGDNGNVTIVTRPLEGHKIKKITIDGSDATPADKLAEFKREFSNIYEDHEIIAEYEPFTYTIHYDPNGGEGNMPSDQFTYDDPTFMTKQNAFVKEGFKFIGFTSDDYQGIIIDPEDLRSVLVAKGDDSELTLVAQWEELKFTDYKTEDGVELAPREEGMLDPKTFDGYKLMKTNLTDFGQEHIYHKLVTNFVDESGKNIAPQGEGTLDPAKIEGYTFVETTKKENGDVTHVYHKVITTYVDEAGKELLPHKDGTHDPETITDYKHMKTNDKENGDKEHVYHPIITKYVDTDGKPLLADKKGAHGPEEIAKYKLIETMTAENGDVTHIYKPLVTVKFVVDEKVVKQDDIFKGEDGVAPKDPSKTGYTFEGWDIPFKNIQKDTTVVAKFVPIKYPVKYVLDGGVNDKSNPVECTIEDEKTILEPTKQGYKFLGWKEGNKIAKGSTGEKTFTAQWELIKYPIKYVLDGGTNNSSNPTEYTIDDAKTILDPTRDGYKFLGWKEGNTIAKGSTGEKTFTAQWQKISSNSTIKTGENGSNIGGYLGIASLGIILGLIAFKARKSKVFPQ